MEPIVERWLPVVGFEGLYDDRSLGRTHLRNNLHPPPVPLTTY